MLYKSEKEKLKQLNYQINNCIENGDEKLARIYVKQKRNFIDEILKREEEKLQGGNDDRE